jgi:hypothetical protein
MKIIAVLSSLLAATFVGAGVAHADGTLSPGEEALGDSISGGVCEFLDYEGVTTASMTDLFVVVYQQRAVRTLEDAADVINYVVYTHCDDHWGELVAFGEGVRAGG